MQARTKTNIFFTAGCLILLWAFFVLIQGFMERNTQLSQSATESTQTIQVAQDGVRDPQDAILGSQEGVVLDNDLNEDTDTDAEDAAADALKRADDEKVNEEKSVIKVDTTVPASDTTKASLSQNDCRDDCTNVVGSLVAYCKQFCGLVPPQERFDDCDDLSGLEKDYCFRDIAVAQTDVAICTQVSDTNIRTQCEKRVAENIVDQL